jgi:signal transduction histidine kinase
MKIKYGITVKLMMLFFFLTFIFYGTLLVQFINVQNLMDTSQNIISVNNRIAAISKGILDNLIDMDVNDKKFRLLKKTIYLKYFESSKKKFTIGINQIIELNSKTDTSSENWEFLKNSFNRSIAKKKHYKKSDHPPAWIEENLLNTWIRSVSDGRKKNQDIIQKSLIKINYLGNRIFRNSIIGLLISFFTGVMGAVFISKSMIDPIKKLKKGLNNISNDNYNYRVAINTTDEFSELATAFNNMCMQLKEDDSIRSDFIAVLSHEIRTPLSSIRESVNMIIESVLGPVNDKQKKFLKIAGDEISRITELLNHLLDVSMLESRSGKFAPEKINPNKLLIKVSESLAASTKLNNINIRIHKLRGAPFVLGVEKEIMQVLVNIAGNAVKFSKPDSSIDIKLLDIKENNGLTFIISDHGPGIPEDEQFLVFKKYYRAKGVRKHMDGAGLGLSISKRIITAHNGIIYMKNNKGEINKEGMPINKGCSFFFTLPIVNENPNDKEKV